MHSLCIVYYWVYKMMKDDNFKNDNKYTKNSLYILDLQEADRQRIARELHDSSLQRLAHTLHKIELCDNYLDVDIYKARMELMDITQNLRTVISEIRNTIHNLRPMSFDDLGIEQAYLQFLDTVNADKEFEIITDIKPIPEIDKTVLMTIYRIFEECINNCFKHSKGNKIIFKCSPYQNVYYMSIEDNGIGFIDKKSDDVTDEHFGLSIMKERIELLNGKINIVTTRGVGTNVQIEIPLTDYLI